MKIGLVLTNDCNLGCSYCYSPRQRLALDTQTALDWIDVCIEHCGPNDLIDVGVIGGEALLKTRLLEDIFEHSVKRAEHHPGGFTLSMTTNGTLATSKHAASLLERYAQYLSIGVSIDGTKEAHDQSRIYHSGAGSWNDAVAGFEYLKRLPLKALDINATFSPATRHLLVESVKFLLELANPHKLAINPTTDWHFDRNDALGLVGDFQKIFLYLAEHHPGKTIHNLTAREYELSLWQTGAPLDPFDVRQRSPHWCHVGTCESFTIGAGGRVYPCNRFQNQDRLQVANLIEGRLEWLPGADQTLKAMYSQFDDFPIECQTCPLKPHCSYCLAAGYESGDHRSWLAARHHCGWTYARFLTALWWRTRTGQWHP